MEQHGFDPQALTSLTYGDGSLAPDVRGFDPQALTSLTKAFGIICGGTAVSIHRLLRA